MAKPAFVLDTSAILCFLEDEAGASRVEQILRDAESQKTKVRCSFVTRTELGYIVEQKQGFEQAERVLGLVSSWAVEWVESNEEICRRAARIKAAHKLSLADAFVAATTQMFAAVLLHKDPEFEALSEVLSLNALPYKR